MEPYCSLNFQANNLEQRVFAHDTENWTNNGNKTLMLHRKYVLDLCISDKTTRRWKFLERKLCCIKI